MRLYLRFLVIAALLLTVVIRASGDMPMTKLQPPPKPIPAYFVQVSPCVPTMGSHYANPNAPRAGSPIYGVYEGKPAFTEVMLLPKDFASGKGWEDVLKPLPGYAIDHVDIGYMPHGHPGMTFAHYDFHAYYVKHAVHMQWCGGIAAWKKLMKGGP